jgi:hypothetical protein
LIQSPKPKGETWVAGAIEILDPEINVICLMVADVQLGAAIGRTNGILGKEKPKLVF